MLRVVCLFPILLAICGQDQILQLHLSLVRMMANLSLTKPFPTDPETVSGFQGATTTRKSAGLSVRHVRIWLVLLILAFLVGRDSRKGFATDPPNVIVIFMDDMGYADIGAFADTPYPTKNLDRMAREGRVFTDFVTSSAVCSASRAALLTGCLHRRVGIDGALGPASNIGISDGEVTLAEICRSGGYATACYGKWHLGHHPRFLPTHHGFDEYYGIPYSNDMWPFHPEDLARLEKDPSAKNRWPPLPMIEGTNVVIPEMQPSDQEQMTRQFTERSVDFIRRHADQRFFLYLAHPMVHVPLYASEAFQGKSGVGLFGDVMLEVDWSVGQILETLRELKLAEQTLVIFTSDNGPWLSYGTHAGSAGPLREGKGTMFEGGYRVPTVMWWPGTIPTATTCAELASTIDILPTVAHLVGAPLPAHKIDGKDIRPLLWGDASVLSPHEAFACYYRNGELQAVRDRQFKLVFPHAYRTLAGRVGRDDGRPIPYSQSQAEQALYDLRSDIGETANVQQQHPEVVARLLAAAEAFREDLGDRLSQRVGSGVRPPGKMTPQDQRLDTSP